MLIDFYGDVLEVNGQCDYTCYGEYADEYIEEEELDCRKENDAIYCEAPYDDYDLLPF